MRAAKVQASLRIRAVSPEPPLLAHTSSDSRGTFRQKARSLAPLNGWACAIKICHDGMLEDTNSLDAAQLSMFVCFQFVFNKLFILFRIAFWPSVGKELSSWLSAHTDFNCAVLLVRIYKLLFPVWYLRQIVEFDCIGS